MPAGRGRSISSASDMRRSPQTTAPSPSEQPRGRTPALRGGEREHARRAAPRAASCVARPATTVPVEPKAPVSWPPWSVSDCAQRDAVDGGAPSALAAIWRCTVVVPLPNSAVPTVELVAAVGAAAQMRASEKWPPRRHGVDHGQRHAFAGQPVRRGARLGRRRGRSARPHQVEALVEAVAAVDHVVRSMASRATSIGSPGRTTLRRRNSIGSMPSARASSSIADSIGEDHLRQAVAAERAGRHRVGVDGVAVHPLVGAAYRRRSTRRSAWNSTAPAVVAVGAGVGDDVASAARSACRRAWRRP